MLKSIFIIILFIIPISAQETPFDEQAFFKNIKESYYTLNDTELKNFTTLVTSLKMEKFAEEQWKNKEVFPLQLIWFKPDRLYLSQQGVPTIPQDKYKEYQEIVDGLKQQMKGILVDLQRFYITGIYETISDKYTIKLDKDVVLISYNAGNEENQIPVNYIMGINGLCLKIDISYPKEKKQILIYPSFKTIKTKWLCDGWSVQTVINGEVESGFILELVNSQVENVWVPIQINLGVQKSDERGNTYYDIIKMRNYLFNQSIELLNEPK